MPTEDGRHRAEFIAPGGTVLWRFEPQATDQAAFSAAAKVRKKFVRNQAEVDDYGDQYTA